MRILFLTPQLPYPPRQGTSIRNYNLIAQMAARHTVDLLSFLAPGDSLSAGNPLYRLCGRIATVQQPYRTLQQRAWATFTSPLPDMALRLESTSMHAMVRAWLEDGYDILQIEGIELAQYAIRHTPTGADTTVETVFDDHNCEYLLQQRNTLNDLRRPRRWHAAAYSLIQWAKLRRYEKRICLEADAVVAVSEPDKQALKRLAPEAAVTVISNGIDIAIYDTFERVSDVARNDANDKASEGNAPSLNPPISDAATKPFTLVFTGKMDYRPNVDAMLWFVGQVLPRVIAQHEQVRLQIVGMNPHPRLEPLRSQSQIEITGSVPDTLPYLQHADAYVIPMRVGGGTRFKALEAMAARKPIVSTSLGIEGIGIQHGREMLIADRAPNFAAAVLQLIQDHRSGGQLAQELGEAAYRFVKTHYTWDTIAPKLDSVYHSLCTCAHAARSREGFR